MRIQSSHARVDRGLDAYMTPPEAVQALLRIEQSHIPATLWDPCCGTGNIVTELQQAGFRVFASDVADYDFPCRIEDYLEATPPIGVAGIITNPPFGQALKFIKKSLREVGYVAYLLRTNFLESQSRFSFFQESPPNRTWISSRRLPMMHRHNWTGKRSTSNTCFAWFVWDRASRQRRWWDVFDYQDPYAGRARTPHA
jgi:hypothetical protein